MRPFILDATLAALAALAVSACAALAPTARETPMDHDESSAPPRVMAKRAGPPKVPPIRIGDLRFEQAAPPRAETSDVQRLGWLSAFRGDSDERLWSVKVYPIVYDPHMESDVRDVWFAHMSASADGRQVLIDNERGERYAVDVAAPHAVHRLP
ncbi:MAG TPA: hypothetical protein VF453_09065 [Burkholderiaceae bacterium]